MKKKNEGKHKMPEIPKTVSLVWTIVFQFHFVFYIDFPAVLEEIYR